MPTERDSKIDSCIKLCQECADTCEETFFGVCLTEGGMHVEKSHSTLMADCIEICRAAANFMIRGSKLHAYICKACAEICKACAISCEKIEHDEMQACAEVCKRCADSCFEMSKQLEAV